MLGLHCFSDFSPVAESRGYSPAAVHTLLIAVASLVEHGPWGVWVSVGVAHGLSCSTACGVFLGQGLNLCLLHWLADSLPLSHRRSPQTIKIKKKIRWTWTKDHVHELSPAQLKRVRPPFATGNEGQ